MLNQLVATVQFDDTGSALFAVPIFSIHSLIQNSMLTAYYVDARSSLINGV